MRPSVAEAVEDLVGLELLEQSGRLRARARTERRPRAPQGADEAATEIATHHVLAQPQRHRRQAQEHLHGNAEEGRVPRRSEAPNSGHVAVVANTVGAQMAPDTVAIASREALEARHGDGGRRRRERPAFSDDGAVQKTPHRVPRGD